MPASLPADGATGRRATSLTPSTGQRGAGSGGSQRPQRCRACWRNCRDYPSAAVSVALVMTGRARRHRELADPANTDGHAIEAGGVRADDEARLVPPPKLTERQSTALAALVTDVEAALRQGRRRPVFGRRTRLSGEPFSVSSDATGSVAHLVLVAPALAGRVAMMA